MSLSGKIRDAMKGELGYQGQGLDYLLGEERVPQQLRGDAQSIMGGLAGIQTQPQNVTAGDLIDQFQIGKGTTKSRVLKHSNLNSVLSKLLSGEYDQDASMESIYEDIGMGGKYRKGIEGSDSLRNILEDLVAGEYNQETQTPQEIQQEQIDMARNSPLYAAIMGGQREGEESIARNASMTGGLRSGNVQDAFMDYNTDLSNQALLQSYNQQILGLDKIMGLPSRALNVMDQYNTMGGTYGEGMMNSAMARSASGGGFDWGGALGGAVSGGMAGIGGGPWGIAAGAGLGGLSGGFGGGADQSYLSGMFPTRSSIGGQSGGATGGNAAGGGASTYGLQGIFGSGGFGAGL